MRSLKRLKLRVLEDWTPYQRLDWMSRMGVLTLDQALRLDGMQKARRQRTQTTVTPAGQATSGPASPPLLNVNQIVGEIPPHMT
jgi:hypothetical protein